MDYCHPCRRHLNGALACPGCGAPAGQIRAHAHEAYAEEAHGLHENPDGADGEHAGEAEEVPQGRAARRREQGRDRRRSRGPAGPDSGSGAGSAEGDVGRRDRKAALHRRRRRRTLLITVGFVLAAGGLSLAELGIDAPGSTPSSPAAAGGRSSEVDEGSPEPGATAVPVSDRTGTAESGPSASADPSASASASPSPSATGSAPAPDETGRDAQSATAPDAPPPASTATAPGAPAPGPTSDPTTSDPTPSDPEPDPEPSPSETCDRFLWWCT
ncbi:SCO2400 family protein [Streptomyces viridiviolaceus]